jgi:hypothetical protein
VQGDLVAFDAEAPWQGRAGGRQAASFDFINPPAEAALEMMMMPLASALVAWRLAGQLDGLRPTFLLKLAQASVNRRQPQAGNGAAGGGVDFLRRERAGGGVDGVANGSALRRVAAHRLGRSFKIIIDNRFSIINHGLV